MCVGIFYFCYTGVRTSYDFYRIFHTIFIKTTLTVLRNGLSIFFPQKVLYFKQLNLDNDFILKLFKSSNQLC